MLIYIYRIPYVLLIFLMQVFTVFTDNQKVFYHSPVERVAFVTCARYCVT